eukprot:TRINITY_DN7671_c0_g1_i11.p1 TRINITY_DN7671_c0_g1~~TRINITY_DN7671_c0_g1_i11.p1  ORF type:complete len:458 (-),score=74.93 TRINITY_DN7671_c0_g1_i11:158-1531(-)
MLSTEKLSEGLKNKYADFIKSFEDAYGCAPEYVVRVPGRVNLIGEHIDYCGYAVHPMAIEQDIILGLRTTDDGKLQLQNTNKKRYPDFSTDKLNNIEISTETINWWSYFLCGLKGVYEDMNVENPKGMQVLVSGCIPPSAGLSSSSALVVGSAIIATVSNGIETERSSLASLCARAERFIGTQGGGMDQAIELLAQEGQAKLIEFNPLVANDVKLPQGSVFVIANSLQEKNKAASNEFNSRVVECRLAAKILGKKLLKDEAWKEVKKLRDVEKQSGKSLEDLIKILDSCLPKEVYSREDVLSELGITDQYLRDDILTSNTQELQTFKLKQRARHVLSESNRVYRFREVCHNSKGEQGLMELGELMSASHKSCRYDYECSAEGLDTLTELAIKNGALGSRLTGAGWGGCTVSLVPESKVDGFLTELKASYYKDKQNADLESAIFVSKPSAGATVWQLS